MQSMFVIRIRGQARAWFVGQRQKGLFFTSFDFEAKTFEDEATAQAFLAHYSLSRSVFDIDDIGVPC